jgi:hypothetical protein
VTASSQIEVTYANSLSTLLSETCNATAQQPYVSARVANTSFTITTPATFTADPGCFSYSIIN